jgi:hypothetical protein
MAKKQIIRMLVIPVIILSIIIVHKYDPYILAWRSNAKISISGIRLMMTEDDVKGLLGKEEKYELGFGGYRLDYPSKGITLHFLNDRDTDFYRRVVSIEIVDPKYEVFGIRVGEDFDKSLNTVLKQGFTRQEEGISGYWKMNMRITLDNHNGKVKKISIGIRDRVASSRIY